MCVVIFFFLSAKISWVLVCFPLLSHIYLCIYLSSIYLVYIIYVGKLLITDSISLLFIVLLRFSITSWFSLDTLYTSRSISTSFILSNLIIHNWSQWSREERYCIISHKKKANFTEIETRKLVSRGWGEGGGEWEDTSQKIQTFSLKNEFWRSNGDYSSSYIIPYLKVAKSTC